MNTIFAFGSLDEIFSGQTKWCLIQTQDSSGRVLTVDGEVRRDQEISSESDSVHLESVIPPKEIQLKLEQQQLCLISKLLIRINETVARLNAWTLNEK